MTASEKVKALLEYTNISIAEVAKRIGTTRQNLSYKIHNNKLYMSDLEAIAEAVGATLQVTFIVPGKNV